jgi:DNA-binding NtrC family response regulator
VSTEPLSTRVVEQADARLEIEAAELRVVSGPDRGTRVALGADSLLIGSASDADLVLHDPTVSARHAEIAAGPRGYLVRDLGAKNGVLVGTVRVERAPLADGQRLRLGESVLAVRALGRTLAVPLAQPGMFAQLVAISVKMRAVAAALARIATSDITLLIEGETGTGKEVAAQAVHAHGDRAGGPFVAFDCGAVSPALMVSELFGHEQGAFSGAAGRRDGLFAEADGGTLFLDEIGELPLELQRVLLRAIETRTSRRVGGSHDVRHDVRIIAATHRNLGEEVCAGRFRQDLYFRLTAARVRLPPLRERVDDIPALAGQLAAQAGVALSPELIAVLAAHSWPGNVRELRNTIERAAVMGGPLELGAARGVDIGLRRCFVDGPGLVPLSEARTRAGDAFERAYLEEALERADGNLSRAAELAGVSRQLITRLAARHGLRGKDRISVD